MNNKLCIREASLMHRLRRLARPVGGAVVLGMLSLNLYLPPVQAAVVGTEAAARVAQADQERARLQALLDREEVRQQLLAAGADPHEVAARVAALSDDEVRHLAARLDQLPAGGDAIGALVFVFIVLLITDILGFTDVFPFVKKPAR